MDSEMLIQYFTENLGGKITAAQYGNALGHGNIVIYEDETDVPGYEEKDEDTDDKDTVNKEENESATVTDNKSEENPKIGDMTSVNWYVVCILGSSVGAAEIWKKRKTAVK